jgi:hypothetical protein
MVRSRDYDPRPRYILVLQPLPHVDAIRALRALLKASLRRYGMRALSVERADAAESRDNVTTKPGGPP